jgi:hypothetical protein
MKHERYQAQAGYFRQQMTFSSGLLKNLLPRTKQFLTVVEM